MLKAHLEPDMTGVLADDIYRDDIVFRDPRNVFKGLKNYKIIFWSLRFHGRLFFNRLYVEVQRIWQPDDSQIRHVLFRETIDLSSKQYL
jgi:hypothetical protein